MGSWSARDLQLALLTSREGVLSRAGHDLRLRAERLTARREGSVLVVEVEAAGVQPICARDGDRDRFGVLSDADLRRISSNLHGEVLQVRRFPTIVARIAVPAEPRATFTTCELQLCGRRGAVRLFLEWRDRRVFGHAELLQSAFGLEPYSTMFGAIRVADALTIEASAPAEALLP